MSEVKPFESISGSISGESAGTQACKDVQRDVKDLCFSPYRCGRHTVGQAD